MQDTPPSSPPTPPPTWPGGRSVALTEGLEDAVAGLVVVLRVRPVGGVFRQTLLTLLVARPPAVAPPTAVALGHVHTDVNGVVTCQRGHREREGEREERVKLTELDRFGAFRTVKKTAIRRNDTAGCFNNGSAALGKTCIRLGNR